jgi:hypothetical protein
VAANGHKHDSEETLKAVAESLIYGFAKEAPALKYIEERLERPISRTHYYRVKRFLLSDDGNNLWLNNHARVGFVVNLRRRMDAVELLIVDTFQAIMEEKKKSATGKDPDGKPIPKRSDWLILAMKKDIRESIALAHELDASSPIIAKVKAMLVQQDVQEMKKKGVKIDARLMEELWKAYQPN